MKFFVVWITVIAVMLTNIPSAFAGEPRLPQTRVSETIGGLTGRSSLLRFTTGDMTSKDLRAQIESAAKSETKEALVGVGHTLLFMMVLAGLDLTAREVRKSGAASLTPQHLAQIITTVAGTILDSPEIWTSIVTSGGLSLARRPAIEISQVLLQSKLKTAFIPVLSHAISSTIGLVGWEFGSQLYTEASLLLDSKADFDIASSAGAMAKGVLDTVLATKARSASPKDQNAARVARQMLQNMARILLFDSKLRNEWFYNTMRLHILTGDFATLLSSMITAGAVGTMIFPGGGTLVGLVFGLVGGVASMFIPQKTKDDITWGFQAVRQGSLALLMARNFNRLTYQITLNSLNPEEYRKGFNSDLLARHGLRSRLLTIQWERLLADFKSYGSLKYAALRFDAMTSVYRSDLAQIAKLRGFDPKLTSQRYYALLLQREETRCRAMIEFLSALKASAVADPKSDELLTFIQASQSRGFDETPAVQLWLQSAS